MVFLAKAKAYVREYGWRVSLGLAIHKVLGHFGPQCGLYWYEFYRQPLEAAPTLRVNEAIQFNWLEQYDELLAVLPRPLPNLQVRFEQNVRCLVAMKENELLGCAWFGFDRFEEDEVRCAFLLPRYAVWDFDVFLFPRYRYGRLFLRMWQAASQKLSVEGFTESLSRISVYNRNSIASHRKLGALKLGTAMFLKLGSLQIMGASMRPYFSVSLSARGTPSIDFRESALE